LRFIKHIKGCKLFAKELNVKNTRRHSLKLEKMGHVRDIRKYFSHSVIGHWNALDQHMVDAPSINAFKGDKINLGKKGWAFYGLTH